MGTRPGHKRLKEGEEDFPYDLQTVLGTRPHMDARRVIYRFLRYERVLQAKTTWSPVDFEGTTILEIGSGPLLGLGPVAVYLGSAEYICVEPQFKAEVLASDTIWTRFFLPIHQQLDALFDRGIDFDEYRERVLSAIKIETIALENRVHEGEPVDLVYSNGVLQHIGDLELAVKRIKQASGPSTRQIHVVNFTDHGSPPNDPFRNIYSQDPEEYFEHDSLLNLKRPSEMIKLFSDAGIDLKMIPYISDQPVDTGSLAPYWSRFDEADLTVQIAFLIN